MSTSAGSTPSSASAPVHIIPGPNAQILTLRMDLVILSVFMLAVLFRLPRSLARFWAFHEWTSGHILRSSSSRPRNVSETKPFYDYTQESKGYPPHITSCLQIFRPILSFLHIRVAPGYSAGQITILILYFSVLCFPAFFQTTGPFTDAHRPGWIAVSQMPFIFAFAVKNNVVGALLGMGYEKLNFLHRFLGKVTVLAVNIHALGYIYKWCFENEFKEKIALPAYYWGLIGLICMDGLYILSTPWWRKNAYRIFLSSHILCVVLLLPAMWQHRPALVPWVGVCFGIYAFDRILRLVKTRYCVATISPIPTLGMTRLECPNIISGWRAGQHVRVRILSSGMGLFGWSEVHPFTIASAPDSDGLVLLCKKAGPWTRKLYDLASRQGQLESGIGSNVRVLIEGPYGGPGHSMAASFSSATFVCGGSGISFGLAAIEDLISKDSRGESRVKAIELVWLVQDPSSLYPFLPQFVSMLERTSSPLRISVFYTRPCVEKSFSTQYFPSGLYLSAGKPRIDHILETVIAKTLRPSLRTKVQEKAAGMMVGVCGPTGLADDVSKAVGMIETSLKDQVGGVEIYEEVFGW